jgi:hypothetical protein
MRQDLSQAINSPPPAGDHETVSLQPGVERLHRSKALRRDEVACRKLKSTEDGVIQMNSNPQKNIEVARRTFDSCNFESDPISEVGDRS